MKSVMRIFLCLVAVVLLPKASLALSIKEQIMASTVEILTVSTSGEAKIGSASTLRSDGMLLTNHHVVTDPESDEPVENISLCYTVSQFQAPRCLASGRVIASNKEFDLALVIPDKKLGKDGRPTAESFASYWQASGNTFYLTPFGYAGANALPEILDSITIWGYPSVGGSTITVTSGFVSGFTIIEEGDDKLVRFIKTDGAINPGNSGGSAFDKYFSFVGVPSNAYQGQLGFMIPVETAVQWIESLGEKGIVDVSTIDAIHSYRQRFAGVPVNSAHHKMLGLLDHFRMVPMDYSQKNFKPASRVRRGELFHWFAWFLRAKGAAGPSLQCLKESEASSSVCRKFVTQREFAKLFQKIVGEPPRQNSSGFVIQEEVVRAFFSKINPLFEAR